MEVVADLAPGKRALLCIGQCVVGRVMKGGKPYVVETVK